MSGNSRVSRRLSLGNDDPIKDIEKSASVIVADEAVKKEDLKRLYKNEIDALVAEQLAISKKLLTDELIKKNEEFLSDKLKKLDGKEKEYIASIDAIKGLVSRIEALYQSKVDNEIHGLDSVIVPVVMEVLYKVLGDTKNYKKAVIKIVGECLDGYKGDSSVKIRISENDYSLVKSSFENEVSPKCLIADKRLEDGQCIFDDGTSLYESGLLDQLDNLRMIFMTKVRENHGV